MNIRFAVNKSNTEGYDGQPPEFNRQILHPFGKIESAALLQGAGLKQSSLWKNIPAVW